MSNLSLKANPKSYAEAEAALNGRNEVTIGHNTRLVRKDDTIYATYHHNEIVEYSRDGVYASWAGWATNTTTNRLNKLAPGSFRIQQRGANLNGEAVDSSAWHKVS